MQLPITGQMYEHPSQDANFQRCVNMFPSSGGPEGISNPILLPTPGLKSIVDASGNTVRAIMEFDGTLYAVVDSVLYELTLNPVSRTATVTSRGTLSTIDGSISWARNLTQLMIVDGDNGYIYTPSTQTFAKISDEDFDGGSTVVFMDSYFIVNKPDSATLHASAINDGTTWAALDTTTVDGTPDDLVGLAVDKRELWAFGKKSVEVYYDAANATGFPFSRREGAHIDQGCAAAETIVPIDNTLMWLDDRGFVVRAEGYQPVVLSTEPIHKKINSYPTIEDAYAFEHKQDGHIWYVINFPSGRATWAYDLVTNTWHERAYHNANDDLEHHLARCAYRLNQHTYVGDRKSGNIYLMHPDYFDDDGDPIHRIRTTAHQQVEMNLIGGDVLELHMETGKGLVTGQGSDPQIMMRYSNDGGYTWSNELWRDIGELGNYNTRIRWNRLGVGREWMFEFRISDPIKFSLISAYAQISGTGHG